MRRYLLVDDNLAFAENLAEILRDQGNQADVAGNGAAALELARATRYDAMVTDMRMPAMGGAALVHEIRRADPGLPALVVTAYTGEDDLQAARHDGLLAVLPKPPPIPRLLELLRLARRDGLVALVEDDPALCVNLAEALRDRGFSAVEAHSAADAARLGDVKPFLALVDLRLPGAADGEAFRRLRHAFPSLPLLVISGYAGGATEIDGVPVFSKPFDTQKLLDAVSSISGGPR
jgi:CheY-like chemotaxis protein